MRFWTSFCVLLLSVPVSAQEPWKKALGREIIGPRQALVDAQNFIHPRIPILPEFKDAADVTKYAQQMRSDVLHKVILRGQAKEWYDAKTKVEWFEPMPGGPGYRLKKLRFEALPGMWVPALLYEPEKLDGKVPATLNVMGHDRGGKDVGYQQIRCINLAKRGMLALNVEWFMFGQLNDPGNVHYRMNQLDLCGTSGIAPFYLALKRGLDVLLTHPNADSKRVAVSGLSGGGWQTAFIAGLDERVTLANPVAGYSSFFTRLYHFSDLGDSEQTPCDLATVADYHHLTALRAPHPALLTFNLKDNCCFASGHALPPLLEAAGPYYRLFGAGKALRSHINADPGTHNYELDNRQAFYRMLGDFFYPGKSDYPRDELPCQDEVKHAKDLAVSMPDSNATFHSLAEALVKKLPENALPTDKTAAAAWQSKQRARLKDIVKPLPLDVTGQGEALPGGDLTIRAWKLTLKDPKGKVGISIPVVELSPKDASETVLLLNDNGRTRADNTIAALLQKKQRVLAVDPFYFGESRIAERSFLFALLIAAVGERPLGIQATQVAAVAKFFTQEQKYGPVQIIAEGPRTSLIALTAAALEPVLCPAVELRDALPSLKLVIEKNEGVDKLPEFFCFGLLKEFDVLHLAALAAPSTVRFTAANDRHRQDLAPLQAWYTLLNKTHDPLK